MTQRIFDIENEKDMQDLWNIVPDNAEKIKKSTDSKYFDRLYRDNGDILVVCFLNINWHDKTEITRPIEEATEKDIGKICAFWEDGNTSVVYAELVDVIPNIVESGYYKYQAGHERNRYKHCRRLTKQEIEELC